ncbi:hypothetical protein AVEN_263651-1 [Araneus ventricosus]|uniref:HTH psq-type domain-containing protein n=1 Tax=Araneus ventricosus TaxID=182803 RepID=A0A4Y2ASU7_ARAVE|nr:hypothetical protein AVEN_263651-1 [Araneus ventricosus]
MVRNYKKKTKRNENIHPHVMKMAVEKVKSGQSPRKVAAAFGFNFKTLSNYVWKFNNPKKTANAMGAMELKLAPGAGSWSSGTVPRQEGDHTAHH